MLTQSKDDLVSCLISFYFTHTHRGKKAIKYVKRFIQTKLKGSRKVHKKWQQRKQWQSLIYSFIGTTSLLYQLIEITHRIKMKHHVHYGKPTTLHID